VGPSFLLFLPQIAPIAASNNAQSRLLSTISLDILTRYVEADTRVPGTHSLTVALRIIFRMILLVGEPQNHFGVFALHMLRCRQRMHHARQARKTEDLESPRARIAMSA